MNSKPKIVIVNGNNYRILGKDMEKLLKSKAQWHFTKKAVPYPKYD
jgi:hypothetical protein